MTTTIITDQPLSISYIATAGQTAFSFSFQIFNGGEDIHVSVNGVETEAFTVTLVGAEGGQIILSTPCALNDVVVLTRELERTRLTMFGNSGPVAMSEVDQEFNRTIGMIQDLARDFDALAEAIGYTDEDVRDVMATTLVAGDNILLVPDDASNTITVHAINAEGIYDLVASFLLPGLGIELTANDTTNRITIASTGGGGSGGGLTTEDVRDIIGTALQSGTGIIVTPNDAGDIITITATGAYTDEQARDVIGTTLVAGTGIEKVVNDAADTITLSADVTKTLQLAVSAGAFKPRAIQGASAGTFDSGNQGVNLDTYDFDPSSYEFVQVPLILPKQWNGAPVIVQFLWTVASGSGGVVWGIRGHLFGDGEAFNGGDWGPGVYITDTVTAPGNLHLTGFTSDMTIGGVYSNEGLAILDIFRLADNVSDTCPSDARLIGIRVKLGLDKFDDF